MSVDATSNASVVDTNNIPLASGVGIIDALGSQSQGVGLAFSQNIWFVVGAGLLVLVLIVAAVMFL